jgi:thiol-disulfide isomerase/thioredoxin
MSGAVMKILMLLAVSAVICGAQICGPSPDTKTAIDQLSKLPAAERLDAARSLRDKYPDNPWVQRAYMNRVGDRNALIAEYEKALDDHPGDANYLYYRGSSLIGLHSTDAIKYLDQALEKDPNLAAVHARLVQVYGSPSFKDSAKLRAHLEAYLKACPDSDLAIYNYLERMDAPDLVSTAAVNLRKALAARDAESDLTNYRILWALEFKAHPPSEYDQVRALVRQDVERLRKIGGSEHSPLAATLREGFKLLGDNEALAALDQQSPAHPVSSSQAVMEAFQKFNKEHPFPKGTVAPEVYAARNDAFLAATAVWVKTWPDDEMAWSQRYSALSIKFRGADPAFEEVGNAQLRLARTSANGASLKIGVASMYLIHKMHPDEVEPLLKEGLADLDKRPAVPSSDLYSSSAMLNSQASLLSTRSRGLSSLCDLYQTKARWEDLGPALAQWRTTLDAQKTAGFPQTFYEAGWKRSYGQYWQKMASLAEQQDHKLDALAYYQRALDPSIHVDTDPQFMTDAVVRKAKLLWTNLGGSDQAFGEWSNRGPAPKNGTAPVSVTTNKEPEEANRPLPPFTIKDVTGKSWTLADLKGKTTLINLWATWCAPCRDELPLLQKLYDRVKDRKDIVVLTLNTDDNPGLIDPFLKENQYNFPVLPARDYVDSIIPSLAIPRNWIVNKEGILTSATIGFNKTKGDAWIDETLASLENAPAAPRKTTQDAFLDKALATLGNNSDQPSLIIRGEESKGEAEPVPNDSPDVDTHGPLVLVNQPLPPFTLKDIGGKSWTLTQLNGKVLLINVWATWCGPCRKELPMVQALYERLKDSTDIQIITLSADTKPRLIKPFLEKNGFTFPVLLASDYVHSVVPRLSIPRTWIVGKEGIVKSTAVGYSSSEGNAWITRTQKSLEKLAHGKS